MRTLGIIEHISLDGAIQVSGDDGDFPYDDWTAPYRTPLARTQSSPRSFELVSTNAMPSGVILSIKGSPGL